MTNSRPQEKSLPRDLQEIQPSETAEPLEGTAGVSLLPPNLRPLRRSLGGRRVIPSERMDTIMEKRYYIAYGSNLNIAQMRVRCPQARIIGTSEIKDYELLFKGSQTGSYLTIEKKVGGSVPVAVWATTAADEAALDCYEGFPTFYYKAEMELPIKGIRTGKIRNRRCYVYIMHEDRPLGIPSGYYVRTCLEGYRAFGFAEEILMNAIENSRRMSHEE